MTSASERPMVTFADSEDAVLSYLAQRTSETIGDRIERADAVLLGRVADVRLERHELATSRIEAMSPWLSGEAGPPAVRIAVTEVEVERWLAGKPRDRPRVQIARPLSATPPSVPLAEIPDLEVGDSGLFFLRRVTDDAPYHRYLPAQAFELAGARGFEPRLRIEYTDAGDPIEVDRTPTVEAMAAAVEWYRSSALEDAPELAESIADGNPWIRRHATRAIALPATAEARATLSRALEREARPDHRDRLIVGLWLAGSREEAREKLLETWRSGREAWLSDWSIEIEPSADLSARLRGPDPELVRGD